MISELHSESSHYFLAQSSSNRSFEEEFKDGVLRQLAEYFGNEALTPVGYYEKIWNEEFTSGSPTCCPGIGDLAVYSKMSEPIGRYGF